MAKTDTLVDAGPLVAFFNRHDSHHAWSREQMAQLEVPLYTCEAVLSETFHLLDDGRQATGAFLDFLVRGAINVSFSYVDDSKRVHTLMRTYADQPMSFADACLVCMAERHPPRRIVTTDDDFRVYRTAAGEPIEVILPDG